MSSYPDVLDHLDQPPVIPHIPPNLELIKLRDCFPYRRFFSALHHYIDPESGVLDYASDSARATFMTVERELDELGFRRREIIVSAAAALIDLVEMREYIDFMKEPGDLFTHA